MPNIPGTPIIDYEARFPNAEPWISEGKAGLPVLNMIDSNEPEPVPQNVVGNTVPPVGIPVLDLDLQVEAATLTSPLARELEDLQADLKKAEELVRGDVRIDF